MVGINVVKSEIRTKLVGRIDTTEKLELIYLPIEENIYTGRWSKMMMAKLIRKCVFTHLVAVLQEEIKNSCVCVCVCVRPHVLVTQSCLTLCHSVDYSPPGSSVHGILQARILEWIPIPFSRGSSQLRDRTPSLALQSASWLYEPLGKPDKTYNHGLKLRGKNQRRFIPWHSFLKIKHLCGIQIKWKARP